MTAITGTTRSSNNNILSPSLTVEEAKSRFASAVSSGIDKLTQLGHGRERAASQILSEVSDGCMPDDDEVRNVCVVP